LFNVCEIISCSGRITRFGTGPHGDGADFSVPGLAEKIVICGFCAGFCVKNNSEKVFACAGSIIGE